jgi:predicted dehydrogenase
MKIMVFGCGKIFTEQYSHFIVSEMMKNKPEIKIHVAFVDPYVAGCLSKNDLISQKDILLEDLQKVIILSPPSQHFCNVETLRLLYLNNEKNFPQIYIEKPVFLENQEAAWFNIFKENPWLSPKVFYVDHYRYKDTINFFLSKKDEFMKLIGDIKEVTFVSLEKKRFWNSDAFNKGYFSEHGCHFFGMFNQVFPEYSGINWVPCSLENWRSWIQRCRPPKCQEDNAILCFLKRSKESEKQDLERVTIVIGKGMIDKKFFLIDGTEGFIQIFFNEEKIVLKSSKGEQMIFLNDSKGSYECVVESILCDNPHVLSHLSLYEGISIQKKVIEIKKHFKNSYSEYSVGEVPPEIHSLLKRSGIGV